MFAYVATIWAGIRLDPGRGAALAIAACLLAQPSIGFNYAGLLLPAVVMLWSADHVAGFTAVLATPIVAVVSPPARVARRDDAGRGPARGAIGVRPAHGVGDRRPDRPAVHVCRPPRMSFARLWAVLAILLPALAALIANLSSVDLAYHLRAGGDILDGAGIPRADAWTFTALGQPWLDQQWGAQVILAAVYRLAGWTGLVLLRALLVGLLFGARPPVLRRSRRRPPTRGVARPRRRSSSRPSHWASGRSCSGWCCSRSSCSCWRCGATGRA